MTGILGIGAYLPDKVVTNDNLPTSVNTSDEWIKQHTGILQRHVADSAEHTSDMAARAGRMALDDAKTSFFDYMVVATSTPDKVFPSTACFTQSKIDKNSTAAALDVQGACSGFLYGLAVAHGFLQSGLATQVLLIGADTMTRILDWSDRSTCILFGDGAGACLLSNSTNDRTLLSISMYNDSSLIDMLLTSGGISSTQSSGVVNMNGRLVFKYAIERMYEAIMAELARNNVSIDDVAWVVPHQANARIISTLAEKLGLPEDRVVSTIDRHANTSAASIPLALYHASHKFKSGDLVILTAVGSGFSWGAALIRW